MLSEEKNRLLTQVGPGTPMGELLRRFCRDKDETAFREILRRYEVLVRGAQVEHMEMFVRRLREMGVQFTPQNDGVLVYADERKLRSLDVQTLPYPGFATDYKPLIVTLLTVAETRSESAKKGFDIGGVVLITLGLSGIVFGLIEGYTYGWWGPSAGFSSDAAWAWWPLAEISVVPVALALGEALGRGGAEVLDAVLAGYEVAARVAAYLQAIRQV